MGEWAAFLSGLTGVVAGSAIIAVVIRGWRDDLAQLKRRVDQEQAAKIAKVEHDLEILRDAANPRLVAAQIDSIARQVEIIDGKVDRLTETMVRLATIQENQSADLNRAHQKISTLRTQRAANS